MFVAPGPYFLWVEQILAPTLKKGQIVFLDNVSTDGGCRLSCSRQRMSALMELSSDLGCRREQRRTQNSVGLPVCYFRHVTWQKGVAMAPAGKVLQIVTLQRWTPIRGVRSIRHDCPRGYFGKVHNSWCRWGGSVCDDDLRTP
jgi:hypothetical protein